MTEFNSIVENQKILLEAEAWAKGIRSLHVFNQDYLSSMWYDDRKKDGWVTDIQYNSGLIKRTIHSTNEEVYFGQAVEGQTLIDNFIRNN